MYRSGGTPPAPRSNLRMWVFFPLFLIACSASVVYVFARPAIYLSTARLQLEAMTGQPLADVPSLGTSAPPLLESMQRLPRELSGQEVQALWDAATPAARVVIAALLSGLSL